MDPVELIAVEFVEVEASALTTWTMAKFLDSDSVTSLTELTGGNEAYTKKACKEIVNALGILRGRPVHDESEIPNLLGITLSALQNDLALATAISSLRSAISQIQSVHNGVTLTEALGCDRENSVQLYANINRSMARDRSPSAFASQAMRAIENGFEIVKCAPFDEVERPNSLEDTMKMASTGIERVSRIRRAVGEDATILVDCHSRFDEVSAILICAKLAKFDIGWFEEPVDLGIPFDSQANIGSMTATPIAGGELVYGRELFDELVASGAVNTVMPDVKYCGGVGEAVAIGRSAINAGGNVSLHSPSGPVSLLASAHSSAALEGALALEHAVGEVDWRHEILSPVERIDSGRLWFPDSPGLGATLNSELIRQRGNKWVP